ncbi:MAG TPA: pyridoxamine 5'-phosphate oxidase family protein [Acidimicrobiales bacterium]
MDRLATVAFTGVMANNIDPASPAGPRLVDRDLVVKAIGRRSFCFLSTTSPGQRPHAAGVLYAADGTTLYVSTTRTSRKARNIAANPHVGIVVPIRRVPVGPPSSVQFQGRAEIVDPGDPEFRRLHREGRLKAVTSHGELDEPDGCFVRITPTGRIHTYGLGMSLIQLARDPLHAAGVVASAA